MNPYDESVLREGDRLSRLSRLMATKKPPADTEGFGRFGYVLRR